MNTINTLLEKIAQAKDLDFGNILSESIELFKKTWVQGFLMQLFTLIVLMPILIVFYIPFITMMIAQQNSGYANTEAIDNFMAGITVVYVLLVSIGGVLLGTLSIAINAGFFRIMKKLDYGEVTTTSDFFYFFKMNYLTKLFLLLLATLGISILAAVLCYLPIIYVMVPLSYFTLVFAFNPEFSVGDIVKTSFKLGNKKWLITFGLILVASLLSQIVGFLLCGIGLLITAPFVYHPTYLIYKHIVGFNEAHVIDEIGTSVE
ncbi:hypothetical protein NO995_14520 [Aestuariibaculum sp. M13]|uniref:hypothetical protein n=1 Tax=Aestuariibaculum sp. M13 TaxID=2967132 RepID=UPI002159D77C|nr:hypothetical protein [Aestuariibaculum sp. M13]MCR8668899.1 hypothetical protein [Aestuariibaculum sp. M13]